jgi:hypothetical protein
MDIVENPTSIALFSAAYYWKYVEYGTGAYCLLGGGRSTPWEYFVEAGGWAGFHRTKGQKPKQMLTSAVKNNKKLLSAIVKNRILRGLINGA